MNVILLDFKRRTRLKGYGQYLIDWRIANDLAITEIARNLGVPANDFRRFELEYDQPSWLFLDAFARAYPDHAQGLYEICHNMNSLK